MSLQVGSIVEGKITGLTKFGAFVDLSDGKVGMVHISEVADTYVKEITDFLKEGQEVKVKILNIDDSGKISLSIKKAVDKADQKEFHPRRNNGDFKKHDRRSNPNVWTGQKKDTSSDANMSFEEMMNRFKQVSDEKMSDLKKAKETKHGAGFSRRGGNRQYK